jgi:hypothetical protein
MLIHSSLMLYLCIILTVFWITDRVCSWQQLHGTMVDFISKFWSVDNYFQCVCKLQYCPPRLHEFDGCPVIGFLSSFQTHKALSFMTMDLSDYLLDVGDAKRIHIASTVFFLHRIHFSSYCKSSICNAKFGARTYDMQNLLL